jgi:starch-binding outer membrane protein, SusD/RagB family
MMTNIKYGKLKALILATLFVCTVSSCNDWLDVSPKSQIKEEEHFKTEDGYKDQLTGVYTAMTNKNMYGLQMGIGFTEVLSQSYDVDANGGWLYPSEYNYTETSTRIRIDSIWSNTYKCIANLNVMLRNINKADTTIFSNNNYNVYKGEALGLRGFLHLEMMRLFASSPAYDANASGVPYVTEYSPELVSQKTVNATMQLVLNDLLEARKCLGSDSLKTSATPFSFRSSRISHFNYYAAVASLARAYLWIGDKANALKYANEIVAIAESSALNKPFRWVDATSVEAAQDYETDHAFTPEFIFQLKINGWEDIANYYFKAASTTESLSPSENKAREIYEVDSKAYGNDYRFLKGYQIDGDKKYLCKLWYYENSAYNNVYPMIRMTEAFYIAAECLKDSDPERAATLLNEVRDARNLGSYPLETNLSAEEIQTEIWKEYRKEFVGEGGQLFFYYKRLNASEIKGAGVAPSKAIYVLPIPSVDQELGGYTN